jgi:hypothetical protein
MELIVNVLDTKRERKMSIALVVPLAIILLLARGMLPV